MMKNHHKSSKKKKEGDSFSDNKKLSVYHVEGHVWVEIDGMTFLGWGRIVLLERIEQYGSISAAARSMNMSYRHAWLLVDKMNRLAPTPLVEKIVGGKKGGGAKLTKDGHIAILHFWRLANEFQRFLANVRYL